MSSVIFEERPQTLGEEIANTISHGLGFLLAIASLPILVVMATRHGTAVNIVAVTVFSVTMMLLYLSSTLYHAVPEGRVKEFLGRVDHAAIYLFIAGSCTPFALAGTEHADTWPWLSAVWALALAGMLLKLADRLRRPLMSTLLYLGFGWLAAAAALPAMPQMSARSLGLLLAGGLAYTVGAAFYLLGRRMRYGHLIWHLLVMLGCGCHLLAIAPVGG